MPKIFYIIITAVTIAGLAVILSRKRKSKPSAPPSQRITVKGNAVNINGQAAVQTDSITIYYVKGMNTWEKDWLGHPVMAIGDLETHRKENKKIIGAAVVQLLEY